MKQDNHIELVNKTLSMKKDKNNLHIVPQEKELYLKAETKAFKKWNKFYYTKQLKRLIKNIQMRIGDADQRGMHWALIAPVNAGKTALALRVKDLIEKDPTNKQKMYVPYVIAPEQINWKQILAELLMEFGIKKRSRTENTADLGRDFQDVLNDSLHEGEIKRFPLIILDNFDKLRLKNKTEVRDILDGLLTLSGRATASGTGKPTLLLVGTPDLDEALTMQPALRQRFPSLYIQTFADQIEIINEIHIGENEVIVNETKKIIEELMNVLYTISYDLSKGDTHKGIKWSFPDQFHEEHLLSNEELVVWFLNECLGRMGEIMQTIRIAGQHALENGDKAITLPHLKQARMELGEVMEDTTYRYGVEHPEEDNEK